MRLTGVVLLAGLATACGNRAPVTGPSPVQEASLKVVAVAARDGVLIKAEHLSGAHQVEGIVEWTPTTVWYESFDLGQWWFSASDWEWVMVPTAGRMSWGLWRNEAATGDGVLGVIRFQRTPTIESLRVWVDGHPVEAVVNDDRTDRLGAAADGVLSATGLRGAQGVSRARPWFLQALGQALTPGG
jgi:hypothetical protein